MRHPAVFGFLPLALILALPGCASPGHAYKLYPGSPLAEADLASVRLSPGVAISVDGLNVSYNEYEWLHLAPGQYRIARGYHFSIVNVEQDEDQPGERATECDPALAVATLERGNQYLVDASASRVDQGLRMIDSKSGNVVWRCRAN